MFHLNTIALFYTKNIGLEDSLSEEASAQLRDINCLYKIQY